MRYVVGFGRFWYDFIVGDDWLAAVGIVVALGATALLAHRDLSAWWLMPVAVVVVLSASLGRATRGTEWR
jgi:hypothetical protein